MSRTTSKHTLLWFICLFFFFRKKKHVLVYFCSYVAYLVDYGVTEISVGEPGAKMLVRLAMKWMLICMRFTAGG